MLPMENIKEVPIHWLRGGKRFRIIGHHPDEDQEAELENEEVIEVEEEVDTDILSILLKDPRFLHSIFSAAPNTQDLRAKKIKSFPNPQPQDLKKKGLDCSVTCTYGPPHGNYRKGQCSYVICVICSDQVPHGVEIKSTQCGHAYCRECFPVYLSEKIQEDASKVKCPVSKCETLFTPRSVRGFIPEQVFDRWIHCLTESSVLAQPMYIRCPFEWCRERFVDDERGFLIRSCPNCWRLFCMKCRVGWHMGKSCAQYKFEEELERQLLWGEQRRGGWSEGRRIFIIN
ncbi:hypothetical protein RHSIM_Rhsim08G0243700 [Rhododendron simsii]|uniref:RBR-type E3 ubiquitin transferase n=1 Tax=Rhododendron simsii TaxID=118357 RepID=A0A834GNS5_RHOSS|nr:hypothetical protein RHSIM_Rhsim08G0243700 [Rhododendron simsii]